MVMVQRYSFLLKPYNNYAEKSVTSNKVTKAKSICSNLFKLYIILYIL